MSTAIVAGVEVDTRHWIGGHRVASAGTFESVSPIDGAVIAHVSRGGRAEADAAVAAAKAAFPAWAALSPAERGEILQASMYVLASVIVAIAGLAAGLWLMRAVPV